MYASVHLKKYITKYTHSDHDESKSMKKITKNVKSSILLVEY